MGLHAPNLITPLAAFLPLPDASSHLQTPLCCGTVTDVSLAFLAPQTLRDSWTCVLHRFSCVRLFATLWTLACQALLSMGFSRQEYWSGLPCPPQGETQGSNLCLLCLLHGQVGSLPLGPPGKTSLAPTAPKLRPNSFAQRHTRPLRCPIPPVPHGKWPSQPEVSSGSGHGIDLPVASLTLSPTLNPGH